MQQRTAQRTAEFNMAMAAIQKAAGWQLAVLNRAMLLKLRLSVVTYNTAISSCRYSKWQTAVQLLENLKEVCLKCTQISQSAAIVACSGRKWEALTLFDTICTSNMEPNCISYGAILGSNWTGCLQLLEDMLSSRLDVTGVEAGCLASAAQKEHDSDFAMKILKKFFLQKFFLQGVLTKLSDDPLPSPANIGSLLMKKPGILVVHKPSGTSTEDFVKLMEVAFALPLSAASRLDHSTSGILPLVSDSQISQWLKAQFAGRLVVKEYLCLCEGPALGAVGSTHEVTLPLQPGRLHERTEVRSWGREAISIVTVKGRYVVENVEDVEDVVEGEKELMQLKVRPITGRRHQIRAHLANIGRPLVGDRKYGPKSILQSRLFLHCHYLKFFDFEGKEVVVQDPLPSDLCKILARLKMK
eukprot:Skav224241  [mRNA]  locus=scaffold939:1411389:1412950:- [translate_table: standard]